TTSPFSLVMTAVRSSHSQVSNTSMPGRVKKRSTAIPPLRVSLRAGRAGFDRDLSDWVISMDVMIYLLLHRNKGAPLGGASCIAPLDLSAPTSAAWSAGTAALATS